MCIYFVSSKVTLKFAGSLFIEARGSKAQKKEEILKICCHFFSTPFPQNTYIQTNIYLFISFLSSLSLKVNREIF